MKLYNCRNGENINWTQENQEQAAACLNTASIKEHTNILDDLTTTSKCFTINDIKKGREQSIRYPR